MASFVPTRALLRRIVFSAAAVAITALTVKSPVKAADVPVRMTASTALSAPSSESVLHLHHLHTGETLDVIYKTGEEFSSEGVAKLNRFLRDHRTQDTADYDTREFDLLHKLMAKLGRPNGEIDIVCGYRTPQSNNLLRTRSAATGVAEHSQHMLSKAIDIRVPGVSTLTLRNAALSLGMGGVGYYPISQFVHVDVGPVRQWSFGGSAEGSHRLLAGMRRRSRSHRS